MALKRIALREFVIVQSLDIDLQTGFTALTGETGAGKSILIDALQLVLGARGDTSVVREGAKQADICAEFDSPPNLKEWLDEGGFDPLDTLLLRRVIDAQGKSRAWINGCPATITQLRTLGEHMLDIHGQHAWQSLTRPDAVRGLLDAYASIDTTGLRQKWATWRACLQQLEQARAMQNSLQREQERLQWQIGELKKLGPRPHEWEELNLRHSKLSNAQTLMEAAENALAVIEDESQGIHASLNRAHQRLQQQAHLDPELLSIADVIAASAAQIDDARHSLHAYLRRADLDPQLLQELDQRLSQWVSQARRYKRAPAELPLMLEGWQQELLELDTASDLHSLEQAAQAAQTAYMASAKNIQAARHLAAQKLTRDITQAMQQLGMAGGLFDAQVHLSPEPGPHGLDSVSFLVAGHPGTTPRPIGKIASGGELSRISLAIAVTTSQLGEATTLIFDEVDSGVGGAVAQTVGKLMRQLGQDRQVLAVTHLPQVAASANHHLVVTKQQTMTGTTSTVQLVSKNERVQEIARMLGGEKKSAISIAHAKEMLGMSPKIVQGAA
jgi:DNA repair protein RecN (Recombination protein N)